MTEQRYGYTYHRVLIESTRILDPQFADAVIYVTGAQLEMLRNMTQYLHRLSTYVSDYQPSYYLSPTVEDYDDIIAIVSDLEDVLMGNPNTIWGYHDRLEERRTTVSVGDPVTYVQTVAVPAGYVHVIEMIQLHHNHGGVRYVVLTFDLGGADPVLYLAPALPSNDIVVLPYHLTLKEGDYLLMGVTALAAGKFAILRVLGYTMKVPE